MKLPSNKSPRHRRFSGLDRSRGWVDAGPLAIIGGCGHVGLPLGIAFACQGCQVDLVDLSPERVEQVNHGQMPFFEQGAEELLPGVVQSGLLRATTDGSVVEDATAVIVTIGTPAGRELDLGAGGDLLARLRPGQLLVLRSTVPPGTTRRLERRLEELGRSDVDLAYCPERIVQGKSLVELETLPQLVGGVTRRAARRAESLFALLAPEIIHLEPTEAELAKLFCNAYRYINFAIANQFLLLAEQHGADFARLFDAMRLNYPRMQAMARPGFAAGPCLVKDTIHLGAAEPGTFPLGDIALQINEGLPAQLVNRLRKQYDLANMCIGILGMAFKPNCDDPRDSLSYKLRDLLRPECAAVLCTDPHVPDPELEELGEVLEKSHLVIVATPHDAYRSLVYRQPVVDITSTVLTCDEPSLASFQPPGARKLRRRSRRLAAARRNGKASH